MICFGPAPVGVLHILFKIWRDNNHYPTPGRHVVTRLRGATKVAIWSRKQMNRPLLKAPTSRRFSLQPQKLNRHFPITGKWRFHVWFKNKI